MLHGKAGLEVKKMKEACANTFFLKKEPVLKEKHEFL
jgi:hypothetical protein